MERAAAQSWLIDQHRDESYLVALNLFWVKLYLICKFLACHWIFANPINYKLANYATIESIFISSIPVNSTGNIAVFGSLPGWDIAELNSAIRSASSSIIMTM